MSDTQKKNNPYNHVITKDIVVGSELIENPIDIKLIFIINYQLNFSLVYKDGSRSSISNSVEMAYDKNFDYIEYSANSGGAYYVEASDNFITETEGYLVRLHFDHSKLDKDFTIESNWNK